MAVALTRLNMTAAGRDGESLLKRRERLQCAQQAVEEEALLVLRERLRCAQQAVSEQRASMLANAEHALQAFSREASFCRDLTTQPEGALALACVARGRRRQPRRRGRGLGRAARPARQQHELHTASGARDGCRCQRTAAIRGPQPCAAPSASPARPPARAAALQPPRGSRQLP